MSALVQAVAVGSIRAQFAVLGRLAPDLAGRKAVELFCTPRRHARPEWEKALLAGARRGVVGGLAAATWGEGPVVLLVHGWEGRASQMGAFAAPLVARGHRVIAVDAPAHGDTPGTTVDAVQFADALLRVRDETGPIDGVVAHSFGAAATAVALSRGLGARRVSFLAPVSVLSNGLRQFVEFLGLAPEAERAFRRHLEARVGFSAEALEVARLAPEPKIPVAVFHDPADREVPFVDGQAIADAWEGRMHVADGKGHRRILRDPDVVGRVVEFLAAS